MVDTSQDFTIYAGNVKTLEFTVTDEEALAPLDLTSSIVKFAATILDENSNPVVDSPNIDLNSSGAQVTIVDAVNGRVDVDLIEAHTTALAAAGETEYYIELEVFDVGGDSVVVATGTMTVKPNVVNV